MSHTPGPWELREGDDEAFGPAIYSAGAHDMDPLATVSRVSRRDAEADARLIAAAPDLLAALEDVVQMYQPAFDPPFIERARAAIAKAKGEA